MMGKWQVPWYYVCQTHMRAVSYTYIHLVIVLNLTSIDIDLLTPWKNILLALYVESLELLKHWPPEPPNSSQGSVAPRSNQTSLLTVTALCFNFWRNVRMFAIPESSLMWFFKWYKGHVAAEGVPKGQNLTSQPLLSKSLKEFIGQTGTLMINACLQMI